MISAKISKLSKSILKYHTMILSTHKRVTTKFRNRSFNLPYNQYNSSYPYNPIPIITPLYSFFPFNRNHTPPYLNFPHLTIPNDPHINFY